MLPERGERPLVSLAALGVLVGRVRRVVLVDGVVGEVHEHVGERGVVRLVLKRGAFTYDVCIVIMRGKGRSENQIS